jgi:hypothetical protein
LGGALTTSALASMWNNDQATFFSIPRDDIDQTRLINTHTASAISARTNFCARKSCDTGWTQQSRLGHHAQQWDHQGCNVAQDKALGS